MAAKINVGEEIVLPRGFRAAGVAAGIKKSGAKDMALIVSDAAAAVAGVFTSNQVKSAPVKACMARIGRRRGRAVVVNSGNANAATGERGVRDAETMAAETARLLSLEASDVFVCSTGTIGVPMPMESIKAGISRLVPTLSDTGGIMASEAIMTTDRWPKRCVVRMKVDGKPVIVSAMAKGAGMIEPNMATMLCFILTDVAVDARALQSCVAAATAESFNRISVDGDMSTNDTVLCFANGMAGNKLLKPGQTDWARFSAAIHAVTRSLALKMVRDGEGATKVATIRVKGARNDKDAELAARAVANSMLVKTSWAGKGCNWGRVMDALGYSAAKVDEAKIAIDYDGLPAVRGGLDAGTPRAKLDKICQQEYFTIDINLGLGRGSSYVYGCDTGHEYIDINV